MHLLAQTLPTRHAIESNLAHGELVAAHAAAEQLTHDLAVALREQQANPAGVVPLPGFEVRGRVVPFTREQKDVHQAHEDQPA